MIDPAPIKTETIDSRKLFTLPWVKWFNSLKYAIDNTVGAKGDKGDAGDPGTAGAKGDKGDAGDPGIPTTVVDTSSIDLTLSGQQLSAETIGFTGTITFVE